MISYSVFDADKPAEELTNFQTTHVFKVGDNIKKGKVTASIESICFDLDGLKTVLTVRIQKQDK